MIGDCAVYKVRGRRTGRLPRYQARKVAHTTSGFVWIGLQQPTAPEVEVVGRQFQLPPLAVEDTVTAHQRPRLETCGQILLIVLKPVRYADYDGVVEIAEIAMFLGSDFVVTVRHGESDVLRQVRAELDSGESEILQHGRAGLFYRPRPCRRRL